MLLISDVVICVRPLFIAYLILKHEALIWQKTFNLP